MNDARLTAIAILLGVAATIGAQPGAVNDDVLHWVNPFIGTGGHGHTFPGATAPFGMVQLSPDTRLDGWDGCSGYHYSDTTIYGFSHTHLSGTGVADYCDILFMPMTGDYALHNGADGRPGYKSTFAKTSETASPGYYAVTLDRGPIRVELTATQRVGLHRYTFPKTDDAWVVIDLTHRDRVLDSWLLANGSSEIRGYRRSSSWAADQRVWFVARFSKPFTKRHIVTPDSPDRDRAVARGTDVRAALRFDARDGEPLVVRVGLSFTSIDGAIANLDAEAGTETFDFHHRWTRKFWRDALLKIRIDTDDDAVRTNFYTALYHCCLAPNLAGDRNGEFRTRNTFEPGYRNYNHYTVFSLWDTFRALHPLLSMIAPKRTVDFVNVMHIHAASHGRLPVWELAGNETDCMIGYHAASVIADVDAAGLLLRPYAHTRLLPQMVATADRDQLGLAAYRRLGYVPANVEAESVSKTLEYAYDDWCIARFAERAGKPEIAKRFDRRAQHYKHLFDPATGFFRPRRDGGFVEPFDPTEINFHYTEANAWHYRFFVPHDVAGLIRLHGGPARFERALDAMFTTSSTMTGRKQVDVTGLIGQYAHGNEPSHGVPWLYHYVGRPDKTRDRVHEILTTLYRPTPDGLCGNEDCGQLSAWYVLAALGLYAPCPGDDGWLVNTPLVRAASIDRGKGLVLRIERRGTGRYVVGVRHRGKEHASSVLARGAMYGHLVIETGDEPGTWGTHPTARPQSEVAPTVVPLPFVAEGATVFRDRTAVRFAVAEPDATVFVARGDGPFEARAEPVVLDADETLRAYAECGDRRSDVVTVRFRRLAHDWSVRLAARYANQYAAGGDRALVDGRFGGSDYRTGGWQGYHGVDLDAVIDLGAPTDLTAGSIGCLQDQRSWIWMPTAIALSTSLDGEAFKPWGRAEPETDAKASGTIVERYRVLGPRRARYVRVVATSRGTCPDWHPGAGNRAWLFVDEIGLETR